MSKNTLDKTLPKLNSIRRRINDGGGRRWVIKVGDAKLYFTYYYENVFIFLRKLILHMIYFSSFTSNITSSAQYIYIYILCYNLFILKTKLLSYEVCFYNSDHIYVSQFYNDRQKRTCMAR